MALKVKAVEKLLKFDTHRARCNYLCEHVGKGEYPL